MYRLLNTLLIQRKVNLSQVTKTKSQTPIHSKRLLCRHGHFPGGRGTIPLSLDGRRHGELGCIHQRVSLQPPFQLDESLHVLMRP